MAEITGKQFEEETQRLMDAVANYGLNNCFRTVVRGRHAGDQWLPAVELMVTPYYGVRVVWRGCPRLKGEVLGEDSVRIELQTPKPTLGPFGTCLLRSYDVPLSEVVAKAFGEVRALKAECETNVNALRERRP